MKIPIKNAIELGAWYEFKVQSYNVKFNFRLKITSFNKINLKEIDEPIIRIKNLDEGVLWLMKIEIVNLNKTNSPTCYLKKILKIIDKDDFEFLSVSNSHICISLNSKFAKTNALYILEVISPKIKSTGAILFFLPDEETEYFLSVHNGTIQEI